MAARTHYQQAYHSSPGLAYVPCSFSLASGTPTLATGNGMSVAKTGTGEITVTYAQRYAGKVAILVTLEDTAAAGTKVAYLDSWSAGSGNTAATALITTQSAAGTAADLSSVTVHVLAIFRTTSATK